MFQNKIVTQKALEIRKRTDILLTYQNSKEFAMSTRTRIFCITMLCAIVLVLNNNCSGNLGPSDLSSQSTVLPPSVVCNLVPLSPPKSFEAAWGIPTRGFYSPNKLVMSSESNLFMLSQFGGDVTLGGGHSDEEIFQTKFGIGDIDVMLAKVSASGSIEWARQIGSTSTDNSISLLGVGPNGDALVAGVAGGSIVFGKGEPGAKTLSIDSTHTGGFIANYKKTGEFAWLKQFMTVNSGHILPHQIAVDQVSGDFILAGTYGGTITFGANEQNETTLVSSSYVQTTQDDAFIARFSSDGSLQWVEKVIGTPGWSKFKKIIFDANGSIVVAGEFSGYVTFSPNKAYQDILNYSGQGYFMAIYGSQGSLSNLKKLSIGDIKDMKLLSGSVYLLHEVLMPGSNSTTDDDTFDVYLDKYSTQGQKIWSSKIVHDFMKSESKLGSNSTGQIWIMGKYSSMITLGEGLLNAVQLHSSSSFGYSSFLSAYDQDGSFVFGSKLFEDRVLSDVVMDGSNSLFRLGLSNSGILERFDVCP